MITKRIIRIIVRASRTAPATEHTAMVITRPSSIPEPLLALSLFMAAAMHEWK